MRYVVGLMFDPTASFVVLVRKARPAWQAGRLNGVGGKVEPGENPFGAMVREFEEETGLRHEAWGPLAVLQGGALPDRDAYQVDFFQCRCRGFRAVRTVEDEPIEVHAVAALPRGELVYNLHWLIPLALDPCVRFPVTVGDRGGD